jgi:hypothetical protein
MTYKEKYEQLAKVYKLLKLEKEQLEREYKAFVTYANSQNISLAEGTTIVIEPTEEEVEAEILGDL